MFVSSLLVCFSSQVPGSSGGLPSRSEPSPAIHLQTQGKWGVDVGRREVGRLTAQVVRGPVSEGEVPRHRTPPSALMSLDGNCQLPGLSPPPPRWGTQAPTRLCISLMASTLTLSPLPGRSSLSLFWPRLSPDPEAPEEILLNQGIFPGSVHEGRGLGAER